MRFTVFASLDEVATRQLVIDRHVASLGRRSGGPGRTGRGSHACLVSLLTCSRDGRTLVEWKERRNTILILHESCQSAVQTRALHEPATSGLSLRPIHLMCRATGIAVRRACSRTTHKILSIFGKGSSLTCGAQGVCGGTLEERGHVRALPVPIVPTTAAGDALHGVRTGGGCLQGEYARRKGHHGQRATTATMRGTSTGVRSPEAP